MTHKELIKQNNMKIKNNTKSNFQVKNSKIPKEQKVHLAYHPAQFSTLTNKDFNKEIVAKQNNILLNMATPQELGKKSTEDIRKYITRQINKINNLYSCEKNRYTIPDRNLNQKYTRYHNDALAYLKNTLKEALKIHSTIKDIASEIGNKIEKYIILKTEEQAKYPRTYSLANPSDTSIQEALEGIIKTPKVTKQALKLTEFAGKYDVNSFDEALKFRSRVKKAGIQLYQEKYNEQNGEEKMRSLLKESRNMFADSYLTLHNPLFVTRGYSRSNSK